MYRILAVTSILYEYIFFYFKILTTCLVRAALELDMGRLA